MSLPGEVQRRCRQAAKWNVLEQDRQQGVVRGTRLPLTLTEELGPTALQHCNTYLRAQVDDEEPRETELG